MLSREEKARAMLALTPRGDAVRLAGFTPDVFCLELLDTLTAMGIPAPVLHGGALRDAFMKAVHGCDVAPDDYDVRSGLLNVPAYQNGGPAALLQLFLDNGFTLNPDIDPRKKNPEVLDGRDPSGAPHRLVTLRLLYKGRKIDYIGATNFGFDARDMASTANDSFCSIAMGADRTVYADLNFEPDAQAHTSRLYQATPEQYRYISEEQIPKLSKRYGYTIGLRRL
jgi:hypothetical protein